jgi:Uma2 family endonuclease
MLWFFDPFQQNFPQKNASFPQSISLYCQSCYINLQKGEILIRSCGRSVIEFADQISRADQSGRAIPEFGRLDGDSNDDIIKTYYPVHDACPMTIAKSPQFKSFEDYLAADPADLPEGHYEYWDGELVPVMSESLDNGTIAVRLFLALVAIGVSFELIRTHFCEVEVPGRPRSRFPDVVVLDESHLTLLKKRATITQEMPPPRLLVEVVSPGEEESENYQRDYVQKPRQYAAIGVPEYWILDPERAVVWVGTLVAGQYQFQAFRGQQAIVSCAFPSLDLTVEQVL